MRAATALRQNRFSALKKDVILDSDIHVPVSENIITIEKPVKCEPVKAEPKMQPQEKVI